VDRRERTVVQLVEARRLADFDDVPHGRRALLLLDNAAETLLYRRAKEVLVPRHCGRAFGGGAGHSLCGFLRGCGGRMRRGWRGCPRSSKIGCGLTAH
jgi:hypothetical protein